MVFAIIQARMGSSRLPGKILMDLCGQPSLFRICERIQRSESIDRVLVATSIANENEPVRRLCQQRNIPCFSGSEEDVLARFFEAATWIGARDDDLLVRITGDCPLIDPSIVDRTIERYRTTKADYVSNSNPPSFPDGLDCEVFSYAKLKHAYDNATLPSEREHVTLYFRNHPEAFVIENYASGQDYSMLRWTLDEYEDYLVIKTIYDALYSKNPEFNMKDILALYEENPQLSDINKMYARNEGLRKSLEKEAGRTDNETK